MSFEETGKILDKIPKRMTELRNAKETITKELDELNTIFMQLAQRRTEIMAAQSETPRRKKIPTKRDRPLRLLDLNNRRTEP